MKALLLSACWILIGLQLQGQTLELIPNPDQYRYAGSPYNHNGKLYLRYAPANPSNATNLFEYDGNSLTMISNPPNHDYKGYEGNPIEFNGSLYLRYRDNDNIYQMYEYDGQNLNLVPNPPNTGGYPANSGYFGSHLVHNGKLYMSFAGGNSLFNGLYEFNGNTLTMIPHNSCEGGGSLFHVHNSIMYVYRMNNCLGFSSLYEFDGSEYSIIPNPPNHNNLNKGYMGHPISYNGKIYLQYRNNNDLLQLYEFDGTNLNLIPNPPNHTNSNRGYYGLGCVFGGKLFLQYRGNNGLTGLYVYDGNSLTAVPPPASNNFPSEILPVVHDGAMYIGYYDYLSSVYQLYKYDGNNFTLIANPPEHDNPYTGFYESGAHVYDGNLYLQYGDNNSITQMYVLESTNSALPQAPSNVTATPVNSILVEWQDNSSNEDGFYVESTQDTIAGNWIQIASVVANVTSFLHTGLTPGLDYFYRVVAYNSSGNSPYSNIAGATDGLVSKGDGLGAIALKIIVHPNPASSSIILNTGILRGSGIATILDMAGRVVHSLSLSSSQTNIDISDLRNGMYLLHFSDEKSTGTVRFVKE